MSARTTSVSVVKFIAVICWLILQDWEFVRAQTPERGQTVEAFFDAIALNDTKAASEMLESNTNLVRAVEHLTKRPLLEAAAAGNLSLVKRLIELGADIHARGDTLMSVGSEATALHVAIRHNRTAVCQWARRPNSAPRGRNL